MDDCLEGEHTLIEIYVDGSDDSAAVVRWCESCGAIVVDHDFDGRTNAGEFMHMRASALYNWYKETI